MRECHNKCCHGIMSTKNSDHIHTISPTLHTDAQSNVSRLWVPLTGVLVVVIEIGVLKGFCAGLGVILTNSAKSKA